MSVNGNQYSDILWVKYSNANIDLFNKIFYANKIGVVKYQDKYGRVWELIRHNVKQ